MEEKREDIDASETAAQNQQTEVSWPRKLAFIFLLICGVLDFAADIASLVVYWKDKDIVPNGLGIAIFATVSFALGLPFFVAQLVVTIKGWKPSLSDWMANIDDTVNILKFCETTLESIPQLWISLYVLSITERQSLDGSIILIISATFSYLMIITSAIKFDQVFEELVATNKNRKTIYTTISIAALYASKCIAVIARVFILVYMTVQIEWWTALFVLVHFVLVAIISCIVSKDIQTSRCTHLKLGRASVIVLEAIVSVFCWQVVARDKMQFHVIFSALFTIQNVCALLLTWFLGPGLPFYLYDNVLAVNLSLDAASLLCAIIYVIFHECCNPRDASVSDDNIECRSVSMSEATVDQSTQPE